MRKLTGALALSVCMLGLALPSALATSASYSIAVSPSGPWKIGDMVTLTPQWSGVAPGTPTRCLMALEYGESSANWLRMSVASDQCLQWTLVIPPSPLGVLLIRGSMAIGLADGSATSVVDAVDQPIQIVAGGTAVEFSSNYPVQSWDLAEMSSTSSPQYGQPMTIYPTSSSSGCQMRVLGGFEQTTTTQWSGCQPWTFSIPERTGGLPSMFVQTSDLQVIGWTGDSRYSETRPDSWMLGATRGETLNTSLGDFVPGPTTGAYASNLPAAFIGPDRYHSIAIGDTEAWSFAPVVVGTTTGTCFYWAGDDFAGPASTPVVTGGCLDPMPLPPLLSDINLDRIAYVTLKDPEGRVISEAEGDFGYALPMSEVIVDTPDEAPAGEPTQIDASTDAGVPAAYEVIVQPETSSKSLRAAGPAMTVASGYFQPSLETVGDGVSVHYAFPSSGIFRVTARLTDVTGAVESASSVITVTKDSVAPQATGPTSAIASNVPLTSSKTPITFTWTGSDVGTGIASYDVALSTDGQPYVVLSGHPTTAALTKLLAAGHQYQLRVRATDRAGNRGLWSYGDAFALSKYQEGSAQLHWAGRWRTASSTKYWGGGERYSSADGAKVWFYSTGRSVAWIGSVGPTGGTAKIYVDGSPFRTISLTNSSDAYRRFLATLSWPTAARRQILIVVSGGARVGVDAFIHSS